MKTYYVNYRCRKCGQIISVKRKGDSNVYKFVSNIAEYLGNLATANTHPTCSAGIQDDEYVLCDLISVSKSPLEGAIER